MNRIEYSKQMREIQETVRNQPKFPDSPSFGLMGNDNKQVGLITTTCEQRGGYKIVAASMTVSPENMIQLAEWILKQEGFK